MKIRTKLAVAALSVSAAMFSCIGLASPANAEAPEWAYTAVNGAFLRATVQLQVSFSDAESRVAFNPAAADYVRASKFAFRDRLFAAENEANDWLDSWPDSF